jgi:hypothetical protein
MEPPEATPAPSKHHGKKALTPDDVQGIDVTAASFPRPAPLRDHPGDRAFSTLSTSRRE